MPPTKITLALTSLLTLTSAALPACSADYGPPNATLTTDSNDLIHITSNSAQEAAAYSINVGGHPGFGTLIPEIVTPITTDLNQIWIPAFLQAPIKCNTCIAPNGKPRYAHPGANPVVSYPLLVQLFQLTKSVAASIDKKYCTVDEVHPNRTVKVPLRQFLSAAFAAYGIGSLGTNFGLTGVPEGAVFPYIDCFATYGDPIKATAIEDAWANLNTELLALNSTDCR